MKFRVRTWRVVLICFAALLLAAWYVPKLSAERYREPIHRGLEAALGRKVTMGGVKFRLLPMPGFTVEDVRIGEDPAIGLEPIAYVTTLRAVPRLSALLGGPVAFYWVDLDDTSVNLTRVETPDGAVRWNVSSLMRPTLLQTFPSIHMHGGRVNFKVSETKSIFYLLNTDVDLWPPAREQGPWTFRIHTEPARTDAPARGFGSFLGRGEWQQSSGAITLDVKLEKSQLGEVMTLFAGHDSGIRGQVSGEAHLAGPSNKVGVRARLALADVHSWELAPQGQRAWPISIGGVIDVQGQTLDLRATADNAPIDVRYRVTGLVDRPRWGVMAYFSKLPLAPMLSIARNLGATIPPDMKLAGTVEGAIGYSTVYGPPKLDGQVEFADATIGVADTPPLKMDAAYLKFADSTATLSPTSVKNERGDTAVLAGLYDVAKQHFELAISTTGMEIASLRRQISVAGAPLLGQATTGVWSGDLRYSQPAGWAGNVHLEDADIPFEAFAEPVHISAADATMDGASLSIKKLDAKLGTMHATGEYRYDATDARPHRFKLTVPETDGPALEALLLPTLRRGSLFTYAFNFGRVPQPDWLRTMKADGTITIATLHILDLPLSKVHSRVIWDGGLVKLAGLQATLEKSMFNGIGSMDLSKRTPAYRLAGTVRGLPWRSGEIGMDGEVETAGLSGELLANLKASGSFHGKALDFSPTGIYSSAEGCFDWVWDARNPKLKLSQLALVSGEATYVGAAETLDDGTMLFKLNEGTRALQMTGSLWKAGGLKITP